MNTHKFPTRFIAVALATCLCFAQVDALAGQGSVGVGDGKDVLQDKITLRNNTGQSVNDLHLTISIKDKSAFIQSAQISGPGNINGQLTDSGNGKQPKSVNWDFTNIDVANRATLTVLSTVDLNHFNQRWVTWRWTKDGVPVGPQRSFGHSINQPTRAAVRSADPPWIHQLTIYNDNDVSATLSNLYLLPTADTYTNLDLIDWQAVPAVIGTGGTEIAAHGSYQFELLTPTPLYGGNVYFKYDLAAAGEEESMMVLGVHPVESIPEPSSVLLALSGLALVASMKGKKRSAQTS